MEAKVAHGELLVAKVSTIVATVEDEVANETTTTLLDEDTFVLGAGIAVQVEDDILDAGGLTGRPVDTSDEGVRRDLGSIKN